MEISGKKILITGASGFIGNALIKRLVTYDCKLWGQSRSTVNHPPNTKHSALNWISADITDPNFWDDVVCNFDIIFHLAAETSHHRANENPTDTVTANIIPLTRLIEASNRAQKWPAIINAGTATQVGPTYEIPSCESKPDKPSNLYDITKLSAEQIVRFYAKQPEGFGCTLRLCNVYGESQSISTENRGILNQMMRKVVNKENVTLFGDGNFIRDYIFIDDVVDAFVMSAEKIQVASGNTFLVGSGKGTTMCDVADLIIRVAKERFNIDSKVVFKNAPNSLDEIDHRHFEADITKINEFLGWSPSTSLQSGIEKTLQMFVNETQP